MNLFELSAKIRLDSSEYEEGIDRAGKKGSNFAKGLAKASAAAVAAAGTAIVAVTKKAVDAYANYEQLVGGVETLFGAGGQSLQEYAEAQGKTVDEVKDKFLELTTAQRVVLNNAEEAYKTAGLSANEYMETVTSFSASLLQSLGGDTKKAAEYSDRAVIDMADNANKMGTAIESIQNAYQGFAKQNYTMLDNLKLGYGGTKEEMARLIADASKLTGVQKELGVTVDGTDMSFGNIVNAISVVQSKMGIMGTTAKEASTTIQGSVASMKAAWQNLLVGISNDTMEESGFMDAFVDSVVTVGNNLIPRVETIIGGVGLLIEKGTEQIVPKLVDTVTKELPVILDAGAKLVASLGGAIINNLPVITETALQTVLALANGLAQNLPVLMPSIVSIILQIVNILTSSENISMVIDAAIAIITGLAQGLVEALPQIVKAAPKIIISLVTGIIKAVPKLLEADAKILLALWEGIRNSFSNISDWGKQIINKIGEGIKNTVSRAKEWGKDMIQNFIDGITAKFKALKDKVSNIAQTVKDFLGFSEPKKGPLSNFHTYAPDMMELFAKGIRDNERLVTDQLNKSFDFGPVLYGASSFGTSTSSQNANSSRNTDRILSNIATKLDNMGWYLDGNVLVGGIYDRMDDRFGQKALQGSRYKLA